MSRKEYKYGKLGPVFPFDCDEGDLKIETIDLPSGTKTGAIFTESINKDDFVKLTADLTIKKAVSGDSKIIGVVVAKPAYVGQAPTSPATAGNYKKREVGVELRGSAVRTLTLESDNTIISFGDSVKLGANGKWNKSTNKNDTIALAGAGANSGAKIPVLFGYNGDI